MADNKNEMKESPSSELIGFLTNMKLIFEHGVTHSKSKSPMHRLFAIHHSHYVVEQVLREKAKNQSFSGSLSNIGFEKIIKRLNKKMNIPDYNRLLDLNKIRNNAEHDNILPDIDNVRFFVKITEDFLRWSYLNYFDVDYNALALEDSIHDIPTRVCMIEAKQLVKENDLPRASKKMHEALGAFNFHIFGYFADARVRDVVFECVNLPSLIADLGLKLMLADDETALRLLMSVDSSFVIKDDVIKVESSYKAPIFATKEEAAERYEEILNIILTYQHHFPFQIWRSEKS